MENVDVRAEIDELCVIRRQIRIWRTSLFILALGIVLVCTFLIQDTVANLAREGAKRDVFAQQLGAVMQNDIMPKIQEVGAEAIHSVDFNREISQLNKRAPEVANVSMKELRLLAQDIPTQGKTILTEEFNTALQRQATTLQDEFPEASEADITEFLTAFTQETQTQLASVTDSLFTPHITTMNNIVADLMTIKTIEGPSAKAEVPTWEMAFLIADIARADIEEANAVLNAPAAGKEKAK